MKPVIEQLRYEVEFRMDKQIHSQTKKLRIVYETVVDPVADVVFGPVAMRLLDQLEEPK